MNIFLLKGFYSYFFQKEILVLLVIIKAVLPQIFGKIYFYVNF